MLTRGLYWIFVVLKVINDSENTALSKLNDRIKISDAKTNLHNTRVYIIKKDTFDTKCISIKCIIWTC